MRESRPETPGADPPPTVGRRRAWWVAGAGLLSLVLLGCALSTLWQRNARLVWQATLHGAHPWLGSRGFFSSSGATIRHVTLAGKATSRVVVSTPGYVSDGASVEGGDLALVFYRSDGEIARSFLTRLGADLQPQFETPLGGRRSVDCGTGYVDTELAGFPDATWVTTAGSRQIARFDRSGQALPSIQAPDGRELLRLWTTNTHAAVLIDYRSGPDTKPIFNYELAWFTPRGQLVSRQPLGQGYLRSIQRSEHGTLVALPEGPLEACHTHEPSVVELAPEGCRRTLPLSHLLSDEGEKPWAVAASDSNVYLITRSAPTRVDTLIRRWSDKSTKLTIYRLGGRGKSFVPLDHRTLELGDAHAEWGIADWVDDKLLLIDATLRDEHAARMIAY